MNAKLVKDTLIVRLDKGDKIIESVKQLMNTFNISCASVNGIGATDEIICGVFNLSTREYKELNFTGTYEILSLTGNLTRMNNEPYVHLHITVGDEDCRSFGGHLVEARISATAEIFIHLLDTELSRIRDNEIGLNLLDL